MTHAGHRLLTGLGLAAAVLTGCGGGDDEASTSTSTTAAPIVTQPPVVTQPTVTVPPSTLPAVPTTVAYVTDGASVIVTNASRVDGAAGRMTERLAAVGYTTVDAANYTLGKLDVSKIYYDPANPAAQAVAEGLKAAFGGGAITVSELPAPPPVSTGDMAGAGVLVALGNDIADKTLDELQGVVTTTVAPSSTAPASAPSSTQA